MNTAKRLVKAATNPRKVLSYVKANFAPSVLRRKKVIAQYTAGKKGMEIGGPSDIFSPRGFLPVYSHIESLDNCNFSSETLWETKLQHGGAFVFNPSKPAGNQYLREAGNLVEIADATYDVLLSSHVIEHLANPIAGLHEWKRVLKPGGTLIIVAPHREGTFDWRRPVTALDHLWTDYKNSTPESDLTHLPEILALHDLSKDGPAGDITRFEARCRKNLENRGMHHHVFNTALLIDLVTAAKFEVSDVFTATPYHIAVIAHKTADASGTASPQRAAWLAESVFSSDRG